MEKLGNLSPTCANEMEEVCNLSSRQFSAYIRLVLSQYVIFP